MLYFLKQAFKNSYFVFSNFEFIACSVSIQTLIVSKQLKTLEANVVKSLFAVLSKLNLKVLQCHRRQTKRFFRNFLAIFCAFGASNGTCQVWCKSRHKWPNYGQKTI